MHPQSASYNKRIYEDTGLEKETTTDEGPVPEDVTNFSRQSTMTYSSTSPSSSLDGSGDSENNYGDIFAPVDPAVLLTYEGTPGTLFDPINAPDNYDHEGLFDGLRTNPFPCNWTVYGTILKAGRCMVQFTAACVFHVLYYHFSNGRIEPNTILKWCGVCSVVGYLFGKAFADILEGGRVQFPSHFRKQHLRLSAIFLVFSYQMAPVLRSLTTEISSNTIQYIGGITTLLHLCTSFYGIESFMTSNALSVNSAIIGSICLTSRLPSDYHCFAAMVLTVQIYILFPIFARLFWDSAWILIASVLIGSLATYTVSGLTLILFMGLLFIGIGILPPLMVYGLKYKNNIYGPWDEAHIEPYVRPTRIKPYDPYR